MNETQKKLNELYSGYLDVLQDNHKMAEYIQDESKSSPLFINVNVPYGKYLESDIKILYVGKENNGWSSRGRLKRDYLIEGDYNDKSYVDALIGLYDSFDIGKKYRKPFFTFLFDLINSYRGKSIHIGVLWTNLLRMDCTRKNKYIKNDMFNADKNEILRKEIEVLKPDIIIFVTGPSYDNFLKRTFDDLTFNESDNKALSKRRFALLKSKYLPEISIRTYHPGAYRNKYIHKQNIKKEVIKTINDLISKTIKP